MSETSSPKPDSRTPNEKAKNLMNLIPLNSYWHKVSTHNREENKVLSFNEDTNQGNDPNIITTHEYYNVYAYTSSREGQVYNKCVEIKYENDSWKIYPNGSLYEFEMKNCVQITKEEFEKIEDNFIKMFCQIKEEWNKIINENSDIFFIRRNTVSYSELNVGDKYIFYVTDNAIRIGEILKNDKFTNIKNVIDRQVTISQECENIISESIDRRNLFVLVTELKDSHLKKNDSYNFWVLNDEEWNKINFIFDEIKIEMNKSMKCDLNNEEECINFQRKSRLEKIIC